ncbi:MFT2-Corn MFT-like protein [Nowakowskiella sp. JEL0407]|nr:MFT2-Corn MFT-like protein [Nowakowskiella sp. JEL0407]
MNKRLLQKSLNDADLNSSVIDFIRISCQKSPFKNSKKIILLNAETFSPSTFFFSFAKCMLSRSLFTIAPPRPPSRPEKVDLNLPSSGANPAYDIAFSLLKAEQSRLLKEIEELKKTGDEAKLKQRQLELEQIKLETHWNFNQGTADVNEDVYSELHKKRYREYVVPQLKKSCEEFSIIGDIYPEFIEPSVLFETRYLHKKWFAATGHPIEPNAALYSPEIIITTGDKFTTRYFTLMMVDLDRPYPQDRIYNEWCHWLVTDIPVTNRLVIPAGSNAFLKGKEFPVGESNTASFTPQPPEVEPELTGNVIFPYAPLHPPYSDPRKMHRYVFTLFEQQSPNVGVSIKDITEKAKKIAEKSPSYSDGEKTLQTIERGLIGTTWNFKRQHELKVASFGFVTSTWNIYTPRIFSALGIHEPVFARTPKSGKHAVAQIDASKTIVGEHKNILERLGSRKNWTTSYNRPKTTSKDQSESSEALPWDVFIHLQQGKHLPLPKLTVPTENSLAIERLKAEEEEKLKSRAKKEKISVEALRERETEWMRNASGKTPRPTKIAATALVTGKSFNGIESSAPTALRIEKEVTRFRYENA